MAAPPELTIGKLEGRFGLNKTLSHPLDPILALQGIPWLTRKALSLASLTLNIHTAIEPSSSSSSPASPNAAADPSQSDQQPSAPDPGPGPLTITVQQTLTGGIPGTTERRTLDWRWRDHRDHVFGPVRGRSRLLPSPAALAALGLVEDPEDAAFLAAGWEEGHGEVLFTVVESEEGGWMAMQVWGFEGVEVEGEGRRERRYVRHVVVRRMDGSGRVERARLVYDYLGRE